MTMSFLTDRISLADEETVGIGVIIKEEFNDDVTEETCLDIKEEPLYHGNEASGAVSDVKVNHKCFNSNNLHELRHEKNPKGSCDVVLDRNDLLRATFVAEDCGNKFSSDGDQAMHKERLEEELQEKEALKRFVCEVCGKKFSKKCNIYFHMRVHTKEKPYSCDICSYAFSQKGNLVRHMRVHKKETPYNCEFFNKGTSEKGHILMDMRVHTKEKSYSCDICNKTFSRKAHVVSHMKVHTKEKPYNCDICNKAFATKSDLIRHIRIHTKEKPYRCDICNKAFSRKDKLVSHMREHKRTRYKTVRMANLPTHKK
ncbi:gastrula zinc finger protein XlCGF7.1-like [Penaeus monodon]|uniref:gastrula zinc finger protein XlCGF7.1-like n=1 Tax=Penaeus monodon TaxID=6687 RepID=UPI0018A76597|nr:gastrula zinc finger protein XlCGF7.1-like [Penaeus monodon]